MIESWAGPYRFAVPIGINIGSAPGRFRSQMERRLRPVLLAIWPSSRPVMRGAAALWVSAIGPGSDTTAHLGRNVCRAQAPFHRCSGCERSPRAVCQGPQGTPVKHQHQLHAAALSRYARPGDGLDAVNVVGIERRENLHKSVFNTDATLVHDKKSNQINALRLDRTAGTGFANLFVWPGAKLLANN